jgi:hypothetical protein
MARRVYRTSPLIWFFAPLSVFVALGFVDHLRGVAKAEASLWGLATEAAGKQQQIGGSERLTAFVCQAILLAVPSVLVGWVLQAVAVVFWSMARRGSGGPGSSGSRSG